MNRARTAFLGTAHRSGDSKYLSLNATTSTLPVMMESYLHAKVMYRVCLQIIMKRKKEVTCRKGTVDREVIIFGLETREVGRWDQQRKDTAMWNEECEIEWV